MGKGKGSNRAYSSYKKPNIDHIAHQVNVKGVGAHKNVKKYSRKYNQKVVKNNIDEALKETTLEEVAKLMPSDYEGGDEGGDE